MTDVDKVIAFEFHSIQIFDSGAQEFLGGRLSEIITKWQKITSGNKFCKLYNVVKLNLMKKPIQLKMPYQQKVVRTQDIYNENIYI